MQNPTYVYILSTMIMQIKFSMIMNVQEMYIKFLDIYKKCINCTKLVQSSN